MNGAQLAAAAVLAGIGIWAVREIWVGLVAANDRIDDLLAEVGPDDDGGWDDEATAEQVRRERLAGLQAITDRPHLRIVTPPTPPTRTFTRVELEAARRAQLSRLPGPDRTHRHAR